MHPIAHLKTVLRHRHQVMLHCIRAGIPVQGLLHDLSKFSPTEFIPGALYYQGEEKIAKLMDEFFFQVACQCYSLQSVVDPDLFCIGGGISEQPCVVPGIQEACHYIYEHAKNPQQHEPQIVACKFNNDSNLIGALYSHLVRYGKL